MDSDSGQPSPQAIDLYRARVGRMRASARAHWFLWILFIQLQIDDVVTTNRALTIPGNWEANPVMQLSQTHLGVAWWVPKLVVVGYVAFAAPRSFRPWPMLIAVWYYVIVVSGNLISL
jgi:hypothetical protein